MKYPIGIQSFDQLIEGGFVYVDKTKLVYDLVQNGKTYFLSRPRRFGKSLLVSTLACYFQGRKELFDGLEISRLEKKWLSYPIFRIDFNGGNYTQAGELMASIEKYVNQWESIYGKNPSETIIGDRFKGVLRRAYEQTGLRAVILVDEYDKPILDVLDTDASFINSVGQKVLLEDHHREILRSFYSTFKGADEYTQFVLLTGVTKFSQVSVFSGFNQPKDISMDERYEALCGITQQELEHYFEKSIGRMAQKYDCTPDAMKERLKRQYDGYHFSTRMTDIYNPFSILNAFDSNQIRDYWFSTGTPSYLVRLLRHNHEQLNELTGKFYKPSMFVDYKADVEQPLPMIYQSGYLTVKEYNMRMDTYLLDFPNNEVREGFLSIVASNYFKPRRQDVTSWMIDSVTYLEQGDTSSFRASLASFLSSIPYDSHDSLKDLELTERHFQYTFYLLLRLIGVYCLSIRCEERQSFGRVDCILEMEEYVYIFEFKLDGTAREALEQIERKGYAKPYQADRRKVVCIGVSFSSTTRTVEEWEEQQ